MKLKLFLLAALLGCTSCVNTANPFRVDRFFPLGDNCDLTNWDGNVFTSQGYLDVAAGAPEFFLGVVVSGADVVEQQEIAVGAAILERSDRNRPLITQQVISYRLSKRVGTAPKPYISNRTISFNKDGVAIVPVQLISPDLGTALVDGLTPSDTIDDFVDVEVDVGFRGEFTGDKHTFETGVLNYPIRVYRSNPTTPCPNGFVKFKDLAGSPDFCAYVGQRYGQTVMPAPPSTCCTSAGPSGGAGC